MDNRTLIKRAGKELFQDRDMSALDRYWGDNYIQHDPNLPDGAQVLKEFVYAIKSLEIVRSIAEGDLVVTHSRGTDLNDGHTIVFDIFRVEGGGILKHGKIAEHWDITQDEVGKTISGHSMIDGPTEVTDLDKTQANKVLVRRFVEDFLQNSKGSITDFVSADKYIQHDPVVADGLSGLGKAMENWAKTGMNMKFTKTHHIVAEGNFVFTHSEGEFGGKHVAFADLFRVENGQIVEHWDAVQEVPSSSKNKNGMF